jgi:hypothetical protein
MKNQLLQEFNLVPDEYGWNGKFPGGPHFLFGKEISLEIHTRSVPNEPKILPAVSLTQANLVRTIALSLPSFLDRVERELADRNQKFDPDFRNFIRHPCVWLNHEADDGVSWTFVIGRTDNPDFGYHADFRGTDFVELWAGD